MDLFEESVKPLVSISTTRRTAREEYWSRKLSLPSSTIRVLICTSSQSIMLERTIEILDDSRSEGSFGNHWSGDREVIRDFHKRRRPHILTGFIGYEKRGSSRYAATRGCRGLLKVGVVHKLDFRIGFYRQESLNLFAEGLCEAGARVTLYNSKLSGTVPRGLQADKQLVDTSLFGLQLQTMDNMFARLVTVIVYCFRIAGRNRTDRIDLYFVTHLWCWDAMLVALVLSLFRPVVLLLMGDSLLMLHRRRISYAMFLPIFKLALSRIHVITFDDDEQRFCLLRVMRFSPTRMFFHGPAIVDPDIFTSSLAGQNRERQSHEGSSLKILMISRIETPARIHGLMLRGYEKDPFLALEIFRRLVQLDPRVTLIVAGGGPGLAEFRKRVVEYELGQRVEVLGRQSWEHLSRLMREADLALVPQAQFTIFDQSAYEALMCGLPVVEFKRYSGLSTETLGGFLVDREPDLAAYQIASRLNSTYLETKRKEAPERALADGVSISAWGKRVHNFLQRVMESHQQLKVAAA